MKHIVFVTVSANTYYYDDDCSNYTEYLTGMIRSSDWMEIPDDLYDYACWYARDRGLKVVCLESPMAPESKKVLIEEIIAYKDAMKEKEMKNKKKTEAAAAKRAATAKKKQEEKKAKELETARKKLEAAGMTVAE